MSKPNSLRQNKFLSQKQTVYQRFNGLGMKILANANATKIPFLGQRVLQKKSLTTLFVTADVATTHPVPVRLVNTGTALIPSVRACAQFKPANSLKNTFTTNCFANVDATMDLQRQAAYQTKSGLLNFVNVKHLLVLASAKT
jgi:hypothetical protein